MTRVNSTCEKELRKPIKLSNVIYFKDKCIYTVKLIVFSKSPITYLSKSLMIDLAIIYDELNDDR